MTDNDTGFDLSDLCCPRCGCNSVEVLSYPKGAPPRRTGGQWTGAWFGSAGRARCRHCGVVFRIEIEADE